MAYRWLDDLSRADVAFEATGADLVELLRSAWVATVSVMLAEGPLPPESRPREVDLAAGSPEDMLLALLERVVTVKDAEGVILVPERLELREGGDSFTLDARATGVPVEAVLDRLGSDVKGVTRHRFAVERVPAGWKATVLLDV